MAIHSNRSYGPSQIPSNSDQRPRDQTGKNRRMKDDDTWSAHTNAFSLFTIENSLTAQA